jgi:Ca2+-binding EF-hand superfamily protein
MGSISGVSGLSNAWANVSTQRGQMQAKLFTQVDTDSSGAVDKTELSGMLSDLSQMTGTKLDSDKLFKSMDSNSDGSLSSDEMATGVESLLTESASTVDFASQRSGQTGSNDDLFSKVDSNADGSVDEAEMTTFTNKMASETGVESQASFAKLDNNSDGKLSQSEFDAGKPSGAQGAQGAQSAGAAQGAGGPPPAGGAGGAGAASASSSTTTYDRLDTNEDGTVSELERLAGALKDFVSSTDSSTTTAKTNDSITALAKMVYEQISSGASSSTGKLSAIA